MERNKSGQKEKTMLPVAIGVSAAPNIKLSPVLIYERPPTAFTAPFKHSVGGEGKSASERLEV